jgi:hypothetical protein
MVASLVTDHLKAQEWSCYQMHCPGHNNPSVLRTTTWEEGRLQLHWWRIQVERQQAFNLASAKKNTVLFLVQGGCHVNMNKPDGFD